MMRYALTFLAVVSILPAMDGVVLNRTTGKPQPGTEVTIFRLGQAGPERLEAVRTDAQGRFSINRTLEQIPHLIEAAHQGVNYNQVLQPGAPQNNVELEVFNTSSRAGAVKVTQRIVFLEPKGAELSVNEAWFFLNGGKLTYNDPSAGTFRFILPKEAGGKVRVMATAPNGVPVTRTATQSKTQNAYQVDYPIKPGETRIDLVYVLPLGEAGTFSGRSFYKDAVTRVVVPDGVELTGEGLQPLGKDPSMRAAIFEIKGPDFEVQLQGVGSLAAAASADEGPGIEQILPRLYGNALLITGLGLLLLLFGFLLLYQKDAPASQAASSRKP